MDEIKEKNKPAFTKLLGQLGSDAAYFEMTDIEKSAFILDKFLLDDFYLAAAELVNHHLEEYDSDYKRLTPEEKNARAHTFEIAKNKVVTTANDYLESQRDIDTEGLDRDILPLFYALGSDERRKQEILRVVKSDNSQEWHDLFMDTMEKLSSFSMDNYYSLSDQQKIEQMSEMMPAMFLAMVGDAELSVFGKHCNITAEEAKTFKALSGRISDAAMDINLLLSAVTSPYYPEVPIELFPTEQEERENVMNFLRQELVNAAGYKMNNFFDMNEVFETRLYNSAVENRKVITNQFIQEGLAEKADQVKICSQTGETEGFAQGVDANREALKKGKTVYYTNPDGNPPTVKAFRDLLGNGRPVAVPPEVPEPNGFIRFFDGIVRFFNGKGLESVNRYNDYTNRIEQLTEEARNNPVSLNAEFNETAASAQTMVQNYRTEKARRLRREAKAAEPRIEPLEKVEVQKSASKEAESSWRNPLNENQAPTNSRFSDESREKAIGYVYNEIAAQNANKQSRLSPEDKQWIAGHRELMINVRDEAQQRYKADKNRQIVEQAYERITLAVIAGAIVEKTLDPVNQTLNENEKQFVKSNPGVMRDAYETKREQYIASGAMDTDPMSVITMHYITQTRDHHQQLAAKAGEPYALARENMNGQEKEIREKAESVVDNCMKNGTISSEQAQWTLAHAELVRSAIEVAKHDYTRLNDKNADNPDFQRTVRHLDEFSSGISRYAENVISRNTLEREEKKEQLRAMI